MTQPIILRGVEELRGAKMQPQHHPGLSLDKFSFAARQEDQKTALECLCKASGDEALLRALLTRRAGLLSAGQGEIWTATTAGPLTLHLSRANALENAGIAVHPLYGFAYLPGSGLKGAARAYAETIWLPMQADVHSACASIVKVFGCAPGSEAGKTWLPAERRMAEDSQAGAVVFHDAWPEAWPPLIVDIAAIHHPKYYQANDSSVPPPGDWETPSLVSFLAIEPATVFSFALSPRSTGLAPDAASIRLAQDWLNGALATLGIGAKTAAGYGVFRVKDFTPPALPSGRAEAQFDLTLVTPAFLAGSAQKAEDCDLRGATLRGQLRWWWRTMHAAHLEPRVLRRLETAVWGASSEGSAVQVRVTRSVDTEAHRFDFKADANSTFLRDNGIPPSNRAVPESEKRKTTQGLYYAAYGATPDKVKGIEKPGRFFRQPGATWQLYLTARSSFYRLEAGADASFLPADAIWKQAISALFLLTRFGGVGAKARKGFGSFTDVAVTGIDSILDCKRIAAEFRERCGLTLQPHDWAAPSLELMSEPIVIETKWTNAWFALNRIGEATQAYAKKGKHQAWKAALGLPRKSDAPSAVPVGKETMLQPEVTIPAMGKVRLERHAAPAHFHVAKAGGQLAIRLVTFVSPHLPDRTTSRQRLDALRANVHASLHEWRNDGGTAPLSPKPRSVVAPVDASELRVGYVVQAELLEEKTPKGGWKAKHLPSGRISSILNTLSVPPDKKPGDMVELQVHSRTEFKWPVAKPQATPPPRHVVPRGRR